jgi:hypothetical protein
LEKQSAILYEFFLPVTNGEPLQSTVMENNRLEKPYYTAKEFRKVTKTDLTRLFKKRREGRNNPTLPEG